MPSEAPLATLTSEGGRDYLGYRSPGGAIVRRPSGASKRFSAGAAPAALADAFSREWVEQRARGEFVWPVAAVDEWLTAHDAGNARPTAATRSRHSLRRTLETAMTSLPRSQSAAHPRRSLSPQGGH